MAGSATSVFKVGELIRPTLDSGRDKYGVTSEFLVSYQDKSNNVIIPVSGQVFSEVMKDITVVSTTLSSAISIGDTIISVVDATGFKEGDVVKVGTEYHYVVATSTTTNTITIELPMAETHASGDAIETSGNTGIYSCAPGFPITTPGRYNMIIENPGIRMGNVVIPLEVKEVSIEDIASDINDIAEKFDIHARRTTFEAWAQ